MLALVIRQKKSCVQTTGLGIPALSLVSVYLCEYANVFWLPDLSTLRFAEPGQ